MRIFGLNRRIIRVLLGAQYAHMLEYRAEIALWALSGVLPFIMLSVWSGSDARSGLGLGWCVPGSLFPQRFSGAPVLGGLGGLCL